MWSSVLQTNKPGIPEVDNGISAENASWSFHMPPAGFESHIQKSIPYYRDGHALVAQFSDFFVRDDTVVYDIGSTTGILAREILGRHADKDFTMVGLDIVPAMVEYAAENVKDERVSFVCANALEYDYQCSNLVLLYYTLQFIYPSVRLDLLKKVYDALHWGGGLLLFEKVRAPDARFQDYATQIYTEFKLKNGYTPEQILNKQKSLKGVLEPFSENGNRLLLKEAGFTDVLTIFKWACFEGWLAIK